MNEYSSVWVSFLQSLKGRPVPGPSGAGCASVETSRGSGDGRVVGLRLRSSSGHSGVSGTPSSKVRVASWERMPVGKDFPGEEPAALVSGGTGRTSTRPSTVRSPAYLKVPVFRQSTLEPPRVSCSGSFVSPFHLPCRVASGLGVPCRPLR